MHSRYRVILKNMIEWQMMFDEQFEASPIPTTPACLVSMTEGRALVLSHTKNRTKRAPMV